MTKIKISQAIVVEGRDDVDAVSKAVDALIIPTHGFGITKETWKVIDKAYKEKGLIVFTDPDFSGEEIRKKLSAKYNDAVHAYISREEAIADDDIGVENAKPESIRKAIEKALENVERIERKEPIDYVKMSDLSNMGLQGDEDSKELRVKVCEKLGIGYGNAKSLCNKLEHWGIGIKELEQAIQEIKGK